MAENTTGGLDQDPTKSNQPGDGGTPPPPASEVDFESANKFMRDRSHKIFYTEDELKKHEEALMKEAKKNFAKGIFETREKRLFEETGIEKNENENYDDYLKRTLAEIKKNDASDDEKIKALNSTFEQKNQEFKSKVEALENQLEEYRQKEVSLYKQVHERQALSELNLDYEGLELKAMQKLLVDNFYDNYQQIEHKGEVAWQNKENKQILISDANKPLPLAEAIKKHGKEVEGVKIKKGQSGFNVPSNGSAGNKLTDEQRKSLEQKADRQAYSQGHAMNTVEWWKARKAAGIDLAANYPRHKDFFEKQKLI